MGTRSTELTPIAEYERRRAAHTTAAVRLEDRERLAGRSRLVAFLLIVIPFLIVPTTDPFLIAWISPGVVAFIAAIAWHRVVVGNHARAKRATRYFARGLDRLHDNWIGRGPSGDRYIDPAHPYSGDLDVFGNNFRTNGRLDLTVPARALAGPVRVETAGGWFQLDALPIQEQPAVGLSAIVATAGSGTPTNGAVASANTGQAITLQGFGFTSDSNVIFTGVAADGTRGPIVVLSRSRSESRGRS